MISSQEDIEACFVACIDKIFNLKNDALELHCKHLLKCLRNAKACSDEEMAAEIIHIRHRECKWKCQRSINNVICPACGQAIMAIQVDKEGGLVCYDNHEDIVRVINSHIGTCYRLGL